jgi:hypothetical protein
MFDRRTWALHDAVMQVAREAGLDSFSVECKLGPEGQTVIALVIGEKKDADRTTGNRYRVAIPTRRRGTCALAAHGRRKRTRVRTFVQPTHQAGHAGARIARQAARVLAAPFAAEAVQALPQAAFGSRTSISHTAIRRRRAPVGRARNRAVLRPRRAAGLQPTVLPVPRRSLGVASAVGALLGAPDERVPVAGWKRVASARAKRRRAPVGRSNDKRACSE